MTPSEKRAKTLREARVAQRVNGKRLRQRRLEVGLTQKRAAELVNVDPQVWHRWEVGSRPYPARLLPAIAAGLGIPIGSLLVDQLVLAEVRISDESLERVKREGRPAAAAIAAAIAANLEALLLAEASRPPRDFGPGARARPRRSREQVLEARAAGIAAAEQHARERAEERRRERQIA